MCLMRLFILIGNHAKTKISHSVCHVAVITKSHYLSKYQRIKTAEKEGCLLLLEGESGTKDRRQGTGEGCIQGD